MILSKKGIPRAFVWEGADGTQVPVFWGEYGGMFYEEQVQKLNLVDELNWEEYYDILFGTELYQYANTVQKQKCLGGTGLRRLPAACSIQPRVAAQAAQDNRGVERTRKRPHGICHSRTIFSKLSRPNATRSRSYGAHWTSATSVTISPWGGEKGLIAKRLSVGDALAAAEKLAAAAYLWTGKEPPDFTGLWEDLLTRKRTPPLHGCFSRISTIYSR